MNRYLIIDRKENILYHVQNIEIFDENQTSSITCLDINDLYIELLKIIKEEIDILDLKINLDFSEVEEE